MIIRRLILIIIRVYQISVSPVLGQACRFYPSCSEYAKQAIIEHGTVYGIYLSVKRILKCHPFHPGGFDPVPQKRVY